MDKFSGFRQIEAQGNGAIDFQAISIMQSCRKRGLNGKTALIQIEQFAEVDDRSRLRRVEADINRSVKLLTNSAAPFTVTKLRVWIRQSESAAIHEDTILTQPPKGVSNIYCVGGGLGSDSGGGTEEISSFDWNRMGLRLWRRKSAARQGES